MEKVPGLTEQEVIDVIQAVAANHRNKTFDCHSSEDIEQQVWIICLGIISKFDPKRSNKSDLKKAFECYLNNAVNRRLANFFRDNYAVRQRKFKSDKSEFEQTRRVYLAHPTDLDSAAETPVQYDLFSSLLANEKWALILEELEPEYLEIFESVLSGESITYYYTNKLINRIREILNAETEE